jgi:hypothetical protein
MPLLKVNIDGQRIADGAATEAALDAALDAAPGGLGPDTPVIVLIHGYKHSPFCPARDPHTHILSLAPRACRKAVSWPGLLGLGDGGDGPEPLCIALGWNARGTLWQAYARAAQAGSALADLSAWVRARRPGTPLHVLAHSLGARVALSALPHMAPGAMGRAVLLAAAEMHRPAAAFLGSPAGRMTEVLNVTSRENAVFDRMLEWLVAPHVLGDRALGAAHVRARARLGHPAARWLDMAIDDSATRAALAALGIAVGPPDRRVCHWSVYLRPGLFDLYRPLLTGALPFARLRALLPTPAVAEARPGPALAPGVLPIPR